jgi:hypothetical protein
LTSFGVDGTVEPIVASTVSALRVEVLRLDIVRVPGLPALIAAGPPDEHEARSALARTANTTRLFIGISSSFRCAFRT